MDKRLPFFNIAVSESKGFVNVSAVESCASASTIAANGGADRGGEVLRRSDGGSYLNEGDTGRGKEGAGLSQLKQRGYQAMDNGAILDFSRPLGGSVFSVERERRRI